MDAKANPVTVEREGHTPLPEAPVSWTVRYRSTQGFDCMLTLRGHDPAAVLRQAHDLMERMAAAGATQHGGSQGAEGRDKVWCDIHNCEMKRREKDGQTWYSHKAPDGTWCRGKVPKGGVSG